MTVEHMLSWYCMLICVTTALHLICAEASADVDSKKLHWCSRGAELP